MVGMLLVAVAMLTPVLRWLAMAIIIPLGIGSLLARRADTKVRSAVHV